MSLRIIYGKAGTGKSKYIFQEIAQKTTNSEKKKKIYIITPEQFSFTAEKKLLDSLGSNAVLEAEVLTFHRMAYRVVTQTKRVEHTNLSKTAKAMLLYHILLNQKEKLKLIGKANENVEVINTQITEFKKHNVTVETLEKISQKVEDTYLKIKIQDMLNIYQEYQNEIEQKYMDENDILTVLAQNLDKVEEFKNCDIYIDEFAGFTKQEYEILRKLFENNNDITITICTDEIDCNKTPDADIFYANKQTIQKILEVANQTNTKLEESKKLEKSYRFQAKELEHLEKNIYGVPYQKYERTVEDIHLFLASNPYSEIEYIGAQIVKLIRDKKYRYQDIAVITKDIEKYASLCKAILGKYKIPIFVDEKKDLSQNILVRYLLAVLNIFAKNWSQDAVLEYMKTGLIDIDKQEINILENYCIRWGIKGSKWYQTQWNFYEETEEQKEKILQIREKVITPLLTFKNKFTGTKDVQQISKQIYELLIENEIPQKLEKKIEKLIQIGEIDKANEYQTSWKIVIDVLDELVLVLADKKVSFEKYAELLKMGLGNSGLGKIPGTQDQVIVGDVDRSRSHKVKAVFMIGINDGVFPNSNKNEGFFNDKDRDKLKEEGAELAKGTLEKLYDDNFNIYKAFSTAENEIFLSYVSSDLEGKSLRPSILVNRIKKIFPTLIEQSDVIEKQSEIITEETTFEELLNQLRNLKEGENIHPIWYMVYEYYHTNKQWKDKLENSLRALNYTNQPEKVKKEIIQKLYGDILKTSVSRLEQYQSCPFSYYLKYGLKLSEKNEFKIEIMDTGTFMHDVIDSFFEKAQEENLKIKQLEKEKIDQLIEEIIEEKLQLKKNYIFTSIPKYKVLVNRLKRVVKKSMYYIIDGLKYSQFEVLDHEREFKQGKEYPPIEIKLENGKKVEITGKIDRIDIAKTTDGNYIRIIDYKSSVKDIDLNEVVSGLQLQLLTYLDAVCEEEKLKPAGVLYFNLIDPIMKANSHLTDEQIEENMRKQFKMKGLILADIDIVRKMDTSLEKGNSNIIPAYIDKEGNLSKKSNAITKTQFEQLQKYTNKIIKQISEEILSGNIDVKPYYKVKDGKTPCQYCKYQSICNFNNGVCKNTYQYINHFNQEYILEKIKEQAGKEKNT